MLLLKRDVPCVCLCPGRTPLVAAAPRQVSPGRSLLKPWPGLPGLKRKQTNKKTLNSLKRGNKLFGFVRTAPGLTPSFRNNYASLAASHKIKPWALAGSSAFFNTLASPPGAKTERCRTRWCGGWAGHVGDGDRGTLGICPGARGSSRAGNQDA